jgi:hypothetical protein
VVPPRHPARTTQAGGEVTKFLKRGQNQKVFLCVLPARHAFWRGDFVAKMMFSTAFLVSFDHTFAVNGMIVIQFPERDSWRKREPLSYQLGLADLRSAS